MNISLIAQKVEKISILNCDGVQKILYAQGNRDSRTLETDKVELSEEVRVAILEHFTVVSIDSGQFG